VSIDAYSTNTTISDEQLLQIAKDKTAVFCISSQLVNAMQAVRRMVIRFIDLQITNPVVLVTDSQGLTTDEHLIHFATETGALLLDGMGDGICLGIEADLYPQLSKYFGQVFNVGTGLNHSVNEIVSMISNDFEFIDARPGEARETLSNAQKIKNVFGWYATVSIASWIKRQSLSQGRG
jgi:(E)-4-hydroxy-3-methylbut-2-enyl-diphosphate synthase